MRSRVGRNGVKLTMQVIVCSIPRPPSSPLLKVLKKDANVDFFARAFLHWLTHRSGAEKKIRIPVAAAKVKRANSMQIATLFSIHCFGLCLISG